MLGNTKLSVGSDTPSGANTGTAATFSYTQTITVISKFCKLLRVRNHTLSSLSLLSTYLYCRTPDLLLALEQSLFPLPLDDCATCN